MNTPNAVNITAGSDYNQVPMRFRLPMQKSDTTIFLLSDSYEYDIELIKNMPPPRIDYKSIIIPYRVNDKIMTKPFKLILSDEAFNRKVKYMNDAKVIPCLTPIKSPYPKSISNNLYIPMSELFEAVTPILRNMEVIDVRNNIFDIFVKVINQFNFSKNKVLIVDTTRFKLYREMSDTTYKTNLLNSLITAYIINQPKEIKRIGLTVIFRNMDGDYRIDLSKFTKNDVPKLEALLNKIGKADMAVDNIGDSIDDFDNNDDEDIVDTDKEDDEEVTKIQSNNRSSTTSIKTSISELSNKLNIDNKTDKTAENRLYDVKALQINSSLLTRINPSKEIVSNYESIAVDLSENNSNTPVENKIIEDTAKTLAKNVVTSNVKDVMGSTSSSREHLIRTRLSQIKLKDVNIDTLSSVTDVPLPPAILPLKLSTTNIGALKGTSFINIAKTYEKELMDNDLIATFMNLSNLPDGFYVDDIEVTDISTVLTMMNNWRVTLKSKSNDKKHIINVRIPHVMNGRFFNNGIWYNIGKQDFPIPILKINKKKVIMTSNYNKISVERYDTRSLVDINSMRKVIMNIANKAGENKYVKAGSSVNSNARYVSTIEYDEYAKQWFSFINEEADCEIYFNRAKCEQAFSFVTTSENEFCCGMLNQVPIVVDTETGMTRDGKTLTDTMLSTLPQEIVNEYNRIKPGKMSMYAQITIGIKLPLGVAASAWEGLSTFLKKSNCKFQYVDKKFSDSKYFVIPFKDKSLAIENTILNQLLFNGFYRINTKAYDMSAFETTIMTTNSIYVDIFNQIFFKQYSQLTTFITYYNFFVDVITKEVCSHYNIPNDIIGMLIYAANLLADNNCNSENHSSLYRTRSTEIIPSILHLHLACAISRFNNVSGSKVKTNSIVFNPNEVINELLAVPNVALTSALNPMVELNASETVTKTGYRGVNDSRAYTLNKRTFDESMIGKMGMSSPNNANVGISRQLVIDPKIESVRGYTSTKSVDEDFNDLQLASFSELLTPGTVTSDDAIRTAIATSQTSHIVPTNDSQPVIISNGVDEIVPACVSEEFAVIAEEDGEVLEITDGYMIIQYASKKKRAINVESKYSFNPGSAFYVNNKLKSNFEPKDKFKKNDILAYHEKFFNKDSTGIVRMNVGPMMRVAFAGLYSTYEDAGIITQHASNRLSTQLTLMQQVKISAMDDIDKIVQVGDEIEINDPLIVFGLGDTGDKSVDSFLKAFQTNDSSTSMLDNAKRIIKAEHAGVVKKVVMYTTKSMDKLSTTLFDIFNNYFKANKEKRKILDKHDKSNSVFKLETLYDLPTEPLKGSTIKGITCDVLVEIYIEHGDESSVGDKLVVYGASKQITSEVVPPGLEPYSESEPDVEISLFVAPDSVLKRMIPSITKIAAANRVVIRGKEVVREIWNE